MSGSSPGTTFYLLREIYSKYDMQKKRVCTVRFLIIQLPLFLEHTTDFIYSQNVVISTIFTYYRTNEQRAQFYKINNMKKSHFLLYILPGI